MGPVGDHLVDIHIRLGAGTRLPDDQRELIGQFSGQNLIADLGDGVRLFLFQYAQAQISQGGCFFEDSESMDHFLWHEVAADLEVFGRALGLRSPVFVGRYIYVAQAVFFFSEFHVE